MAMSFLRQIVTECQATHCWDEALDQFNIESVRKEIDYFNLENTFYKKDSR